MAFIIILLVIAFFAILAMLIAGIVLVIKKIKSLGTAVNFLVFNSLLLCIFAYLTNTLRLNTSLQTLNGATSIVAFPCFLLTIMCAETIILSLLILPLKKKKPNKNIEIKDENIIENKTQKLENKDELELKTNDHGEKLYAN